jgi:RHS repeat-associated protein
MTCSGYPRNEASTDPSGHPSLASASASSNNTASTIHFASPMTYPAARAIEVFPEQHCPAGGRSDRESRNNYRARYYSSNDARWMTPDWSSDPEAVPYADLTDPQSLNLYSYVGNNPLSSSDSDGHVQVCGATTVSTDANGDTVVHANCRNVQVDTSFATRVQNAWDSFQNFINSQPTPYVPGVNSLGAPACACMQNSNQQQNNKQQSTSNQSSSAKRKWTYGWHKSAKKWASQMAARGWTEDQIDEAIEHGEQFSAPNDVNKGNGATRFVNPTTGRSVVVDNVTGEILHVGGDGFKY